MMASLPKHERFVVAGPATLRNDDDTGPSTVLAGTFAVAYDDGKGPRRVSGGSFLTVRDAQAEADWYNRGRPD